MFRRVLAVCAAVLALGLVMSCEDDDGGYIAPPPASTAFGAWTGMALSAFPVTLVLAQDSTYTIRATMTDTLGQTASIYYEDGGYGVNATQDTLTLAPDTCGSPLTACDLLPRKAALNMSAGTIAYALVVENNPYAVTLTKE